jgi:hypothetical protein
MLYYGIPRFGNVIHLPFLIAEVNDNFINKKQFVQLEKSSFENINGIESVLESLQFGINIVDFLCNFLGLIFGFNGIHYLKLLPSYHAQL